MIKKIDAHYRVIEALQEIVWEEAVPVKITLGNETIDYNGDKQVSACLEFDDTDNAIVNDSLTKAVNYAIDIICEDN